MGRMSTNSYINGAMKNTTYNNTERWEDNSIIQDREFMIFFDDKKSQKFTFKNTWTLIQIQS